MFAQTRMQGIINTFQNAVQTQAKYVAVMVRIGDTHTRKIRINSIENVKKKRKSGEKNCAISLCLEHDCLKKKRTLGKFYDIVK